MNENKKFPVLEKNATVVVANYAHI